MKPLSLNDVTKYVEDNIGHFHQKRISSLDGLSLKNVLKRKNPYLFRAKYVLTAGDLIKGVVDAHISSHEETIFGDQGYALMGLEVEPQILDVLRTTALHRSFYLGVNTSKSWRYGLLEITPSSWGTKITSKWF